MSAMKQTNPEPNKPDDRCYNVKRDELIHRLQRTEQGLWLLICHLERKIRCPDGEGNYSNLINASTDVIPVLHEMRRVVFGQE
jgi:hypothetical protein